MLKYIIFLFYISVVYCDKYTTGRGGKCGILFIYGAYNNVNCGSDLECKNGYCESISYISGGTSLCRNKLYNLGLPKGTYVGFFENYCFYEDSSCKNMYNIILNKGIENESDDILSDIFNERKENITAIDGYCSKCNYCLKLKLY